MVEVGPFLAFGRQLGDRLLLVRPRAAA